ncbi:MAG: hypothetical protein PHT54_00690 [Candidatus Nanoarchaeia archaeon]|nr:hypothetical protein [Candidatus Nanoarchaeia archaeon]
MQKNSKTLVIGFLIIVIIALVVTLMGGITGRNVSDKAIISVEPKFVNAGEYIDITIKPTTSGFNKMYRICDGRTDSCRVEYPFKCGEYKCNQPLTVRYKTHADWDGLYYVKAFDYKNEEWVKSYFTVVNE